MAPKNAQRFRAAAAASVAAENNERNKLQRFLRVFIIFIVFLGITFTLFHRVQNSVILDGMNGANNVFYAATHNTILNVSDSEHMIDFEHLHLPILNAYMSGEHGKDDTDNKVETSPVSAGTGSYSDARLDMLKKLTAFRQRTDEMLHLITDTSIAEEKPFIRWDLISNAEVHILNKLSRHLNRVLKRLSEDPSYQNQLLGDIKNGYQCSPLQAVQQEHISKFIKMDICSEVEWYKVLQLAWPEANDFIDVGANKGELIEL